MALCLCCISCGNSSATSKKQDTPTKEEVNQAISDSIQTISGEISEIKKNLLKEIAKIENKQNAKEKNQTNKWLVYSWLALLSGVIVWLVYCWNKVAEKKDLRHLEFEMDNIRKKLDAILKMQEQDVPKKNLMNRDNDAIKIQVQNILERLLVVENIIKESSTKNKKESRLEPVPERAKEGYFGIVKGYGFFNDVYSSQKDESKFKVWFKSNEKEAEFDLIDLRRIKSFDGIEKAVHFDTTDASLQEASSYETLKRGKAIKDGDIWEIKQKVSVRLKI